MKTFIFKGRSMFPTLREGDILVLNNTKEDISCGDIAVLNKSGNTICHRIIFKFKIGKKIFFLQKGDNCLGAHLIQPEDIIGKVKKIYRKDSILYPHINTFVKTYVFITYIIFFTLRKIKAAFFKNINFNFFNKLVLVHKAAFISFRTTRS